MSAAAVPRLSWFPVRLIAEVHAGRASASEWIAGAPRLGFDAVELHAAFVASDGQLADVTAELWRARLDVSMLTCAPDFTDPAPGVRDAEIAAMRRHVDIAADLRTPAVRVTAGPEHPGVSFDDALPGIVDAFAAVAEHAERRGVTVCVENHYRDRTWDAPDVTAPPERFARLLHATADLPIRVNYDSAQPMVIDVDELALLDEVLPRVVHVHLGDRRRRQRPHAVLGEGDVDLRGILARLHARGYERFLTVEDGNPEGDAGLRRGLAHVRDLVAEQWRPA
jgi:sugar phosphate isomerase/epimerase